MNSSILQAGLGFYFLAMCLYVAYAATKRETLATWGHLCLTAGLAFHISSWGFQVALHVAAGGPGLDWFKSLSFFTLVIVIEYLVIQGQNPMPILGAFVTPLIVAVGAAALRGAKASTMPRSTIPLSLSSHWLAIHVPMIFLAYGCFTIAFAVGLVYLIQESQIKSKKPTHLTFRLPPLDDLDYLIYRILRVGWPALAVGLVLGALWAEKAWGRYWGWDAKETSSLVTLIVYTIYLYLRIVSGWRGRRTVYVSLIGFAMVLVTYVGMNYFSSLHGFFPEAR